MRTFAVFALLAVAAYAQLETGTPEPAIVKRQAESQPEIKPLITIEFVDSDEKREPETASNSEEGRIAKRQVDPEIVPEDSKNDEHKIVRREVTAADPEEETPEETSVPSETDSETDPAPEDDEETEDNEESATAAPEEDSATDDEEETADEDNEATSASPIPEADDDEETADIVKRETGTDTDTPAEEDTAPEDDEETDKHIIAKRDADPETKPETEEKPVVEGEVMRKKRYNEHAYPDCSCLHKYPKLPLYTKLHAHCHYPGKPHPPTCAHPPCHRPPPPPCGTCGHNHGPKAPCHGSGSVYHHHHVHVVPHAPVHRVHHDVHHHFVPKRPHYRAPCDRAHSYGDDIYKH